MSQFLDAYPERGAQPPTLPGQTRFTGTVLTQLRRQQLHDLARAYRISVPSDGTKEEILPSLISAERAGVFRTQSPDPYWFAKANRDPENPEPLPPGLAAPGARARPPGDLPTAQDGPPPSIAELRAACKAAGINSFGKTKAAMKEALDAGGES